MNGNDLMDQDEIRRLTDENKTLHEEVAALESREVCTMPHADRVIVGCPVCRIEEMERLHSHFAFDAGVRVGKAYKRIAELMVAIKGEEA